VPRSRSKRGSTGTRSTACSSSLFRPPINDRPILPQDRYSPRIDQGERLYRFSIQGGPLDECLAAINREALTHNETPVALSFFPEGEGEPPGAFITLSDEAVQLSAQKTDRGWKWSGPTPLQPDSHSTCVEFPALGISQEVHLSAFEIRNYRIAGQKWVEVELMEKALCFNQDGSRSGLDQTDYIDF
jgi:alpha-mannosidase